MLFMQKGLEVGGLTCPDIEIGLSEHAHFCSGVIDIPLLPAISFSVAELASEDKMPRDCQLLRHILSEPQPFTKRHVCCSKRGRQLISFLSHAKWPYVRAVRLQPGVRLLRSLSSFQSQTCPHNLWLSGP